MTDTELGKGRVDILQPADLGGVVRQIDNAVLAAVQRGIELLSSFQRGPENDLEILGTHLRHFVKEQGACGFMEDPFRLCPIVGNAAGVADAVVPGHNVHPVGALVGENHWLIAVEVIDNAIIIGRIQQRNAHHIVVVYAADDQPCPGSNRAHGLDIPAHQRIPGIGHLK